MLAELRRRLTRIYLFVLGALLVAYSLVAFLIAQNVLGWGLDEANHHLAMGVVAGLQATGATGATVGHELAELHLTPDERIEVVDARGRRLGARNGTLPDGAPLVAGASTTRGDERFRVLTVPVVVDGRPIAYVRAAHSLADSQHGMALLAGALTVLLPIALLIAWATGDWLAGEAVRPVEAAMARERQFLRDAAHELRTPLAALQMQSELAEASPDLPESARERLAPLTRTVRRMTALVGDLLAISREDAQLTGEIRRFALDELVEEEVALMAPIAAARGLTLDWKPPSDEVLVLGDADRLARTVRNLLDNAIRYATAGPVTLRLAAEGAQALLSVSNPSEPLSGAERERIFERFYRPQASHAPHPEGTGLGLAIARAIARAHGGELALSSPPGPTTTFTLTIPRG